MRIATPGEIAGLFVTFLTSVLTNNMEQESQFLVSLLKSVQKRLKTSKMFEHFVNSKYSQNFHKPDNFPGLSNNFHILQPFQEQRDVKGYEADEVHNIHWFHKKADLIWRHEETRKVFK